jgi:beta-carotene hydroxylase
LIGGMFWVYAFDFLPHYPFVSTARFLDTRIQTGRIRHFLLLGQNYHLIHHLWVSVPWFSYRAVFNELEPQLRQAEARIE